MPTVTGELCPSVGAAIDPATRQVMAWTSATGRLAHLIPLAPATARAWAAQLLDAAEAAETLATGEEDEP